MRKMRLTALLAVLLLLLGCGAGDSKLDVRAGGKTLPFSLKSSGIYNAVKTFTETKDGQTNVAKASSIYIVLGNYDIDTSSGMISMEKPVTAADQVRISIQLIGQEGTDDKTGLKTGTYPAKADKFGKIDYVNVAYFADGKESKNIFDIAKAAGEVRITSVSAEAVSGEIDLTEGDKSIKGSFTAKLPVKK
ncbi:MAG: hypothetical protein JSS81_19815 [Acidobacteria bacterium]|nr:hypothetical protein [Acidobacteriota bacterium]